MEALAHMALTRDQIVAAAVRILDEEGPDALSMRRLGRELDAGTTSVYWHVRGKDELLDLVADRIIGEVFAGLLVHDVPEGAVTAGGWRAWMAAFARSMRVVLLRHRGAAPIVARRAVVAPNAMAALEALLATMVADGFDGRTALLASTVLVGWTSSLVGAEVEGELAPDADAIAGALGSGRHPVTAVVLQGTAAPTADERFDYGLDVLLDGIEARELRRRAAVGEGSGAGEGG